CRPQSSQIYPGSRTQESGQQEVIRCSSNVKRQGVGPAAFLFWKRSSNFLLPKLAAVGLRLLPAVEHNQEHMPISRREFLRVTGMASLALSRPSLLASASPAESPATGSTHAWEIHVDAGRAVHSFDPDQALGSSMD